jgi:hypothetical protein
MSIEWKAKSCEISLDRDYVEGLDSGLFEDLKYRPNKYFHPIEDVALIDGKCVITYQRELTPVDGKVSLDQILHVLQGAVDATQRLAQDQVFYLYPGVNAFVQDRRRNVRIGLINVCPQTSRERPSQELCVDAFIQLLAEHCPSGHRRVVSYNKPILTLRHLQQVLTGQGTSPLLMMFLLLVFLGGGIYGSLYQWGPPRVKQTLRVYTAQALQMGKRVLRSGTEEWHVQASQERKKREYAFAPVPFTLIIEPTSKDRAVNEKLYRKLATFLMKEFPANAKPLIRYQLLIPDASKFPKAHAMWKQLCDNAFPRRCSENSWLLHFPAYPGGWRPLIEAIKESVREAKSKASGQSISEDLLRVQYVGFSGLLQLSLKPGVVKKAKPRQRPPVRRTAVDTRVAPKPTQPRPRVDRFVPPRPTAPALRRDVLTPRLAPQPRQPERTPPVRQPDAQ